ncbi:hypothetical protein SS50377_26048 [Spironucleus salmonicida]|uniref:Uncharacterized protein n=1 Tax=Spironucleus salmonicida TaxID=348837 RepID=A0A9P8RWV2_9EUKA|nr:hypothetical protein SS50377_26048 [Spironucleus salmonicida]
MNVPHSVRTTLQSSARSPQVTRRAFLLLGERGSGSGPWCKRIKTPKSGRISSFTALQKGAESEQILEFWLLQNSASQAAIEKVGCGCNFGGNTDRANEKISS